MEEVSQKIKHISVRVALHQKTDFIPAELVSDKLMPAHAHACLNDNDNDIDNVNDYDNDNVNVNVNVNLYKAL